MTEYVWQLGIDWNAIQTGGVGYLRGAVAKKVNGELDPLPGTEIVHTGDTITFRIFDVSSSVPPGRRVAAIGSFGIDSQAAVEGQHLGNPLNSLQPAIVSSSTESGQSSPFGDAYCSWTSEPVTVTEAAAPGRFLLTVYLQATGLDDVVRLFNHDPEMVVGPHGG